MLLVIDVGNTNIVLGLFEGEELHQSWRVNTSRQKTADEYGILFRALLEHSNFSAEMVHAVIISSVVPPLTSEIVRMIKRYFEHEPLVVGPGLKTGMPIFYESPRDVGADRIVNAVAAYHRFETAGVVVDFGTATTFDAIGPQGEYMGGAIAPGIRIGAEALFQRASKLPRVNVERPTKVIGRNTVHSIQSGLFFGYVGLVDEMVRRMENELEGETFVIATGGLANLIASESKTIQSVEDNLTLDGLRLLYERNQARKA